MPYQTLRKILPALFLLTAVLPIASVNAQTAQTTPTVAQPTTALPGESFYDYSMRLGYAASKRGDYATALAYFYNALSVRPGDRLATIAYWNMSDLVNKTQNSQATSATAATTAETSDYDRYMRIGYEATEKGNYQTALINFRRALEQRSDDPYALQAIRNVQTYIERGTQAENRPLLRRTLDGSDIGQPVTP